MFNFLPTEIVFKLCPNKIANDGGGMYTMISSWYLCSWAVCVLGNHNHRNEKVDNISSILSGILDHHNSYIEKHKTFIWM